MTEDNTSKLLFELAYKELEFERRRAFNLETKALRYITLGGILFSILTTYFLFHPDSEFLVKFIESFKWFKLMFILSYFGYIISWIPLIFCMKTYTSETFDIEKLIEEYKDVLFQTALKDITKVELKVYVKKIAEKTKSKSTALFWGFIIIILSTFFIISGMTLYFFNL